VFWGKGVWEALDLEVAVESFESVQECKGVNCSISIVCEVKSTKRIHAVDV